MRSNPFVLSVLAITAILAAPVTGHWSKGQSQQAAADDPIKTLGDFKAGARLHRDVAVEITVHVVKEE